MGSGGKMVSKLGPASVNFALGMHIKIEGTNIFKCNVAIQKGQEPLLFEYFTYLMHESAQTILYPLLTLFCPPADLY